MTAELSAKGQGGAPLLAELRAEALQSGRPFLEVLAESPSASSWTIPQWLSTLGDYFHYPTADMAGLDALRAEFGDPAFDCLDLREAMQSGCVFWKTPRSYAVAVLTDPLAIGSQGRIEALAGQPVRWYLAHPGDVGAMLARYEETARAWTTLEVDSTQAVAASDDDDISLETLGRQASLPVRIVNSTLYDAMKAGASDIHLETTTDGLQIKYRIDGVLLPAGDAAGAEAAEQVISRVKVMSGLDIAERRVPQDGRFKARIRGREIDFRVSIMPSVFGEDAVIRILDKESLAGSMRNLQLDALGFDAAALSVIRNLVSEPYGMFLVTGPTGSGKTTTLYAALTEINNGQEKIVTIEDPVEYQLPGVLQIPVNEKKGLGFARGLRSILRHDPDKIMIGEIRDAETAEIAIQSALTGHLVLTTVHANNVFDVVGRFMHMGIDPYGLVSALNGILAQRLVRLVCHACAQEKLPDAHLLGKSGLGRIPTGHWRFLEGVGCGQCRGTGYKGRKAISECLVMDDELRDMIVNRAPSREMKAAAASRGTRSLRQAALDLVREGETTLAEANRVTSLHEFDPGTIR